MLNPNFRLPYHCTAINQYWTMPLDLGCLPTALALDLVTTTSRSLFLASPSSSNTFVECNNKIINNASQRQQTQEWKANGPVQL
jgi:hypothetical protein